MHTRDPFRRPGVADEIEAQLQMQEERRLEAARLTMAEAEIAQLATRVRWGTVAAGILAALVALVAVAYVAELFPRPAAVRLTPTPPASPTTEPRPSAAPRITSEQAPSPIPSPHAASTPVRVVPIPKLAGAEWRTALESAPAPASAPAAAPETQGAVDQQPAQLAFTPVAPARVLPLYPVPPSSLSSPRTASVGKEYLLKAAFIAKIAGFVRWPQADPATRQFMTIGILGDDPFGNTLDQFARVIRSRRADDLYHAQIVFISKSEVPHLREILFSFFSEPTLTVGESEGFTRQGGMIGLEMEGDKVRFRINPSAVRHSGLAIDDQLVQLAVGVDH